MSEWQPIETAPGEQPMVRCVRAFGHDGPRWSFYWWFVGWDCLSLGVSICTSLPNVEIHLPFGFIRIGRNGTRKI